MSTSTSWIIRSSAASVLLGLISPTSDAQVIVQQRSPLLIGDRLRMATPSQGQAPPAAMMPIMRGPSIVGMPSINGAANYLQYATGATGSARWNPPFDAGSANPIARGAVLANPLMVASGWDGVFVPNPPIGNRMARNPFGLNQLLMNPLVGNRLADPLNGPILLAGGWGVPLIPARDEESPLAEARRPGSMLDQTPEFSLNPIATTVYQPASGIVTLPDGSTFYRGAAIGAPVGLSDSSVGGGLDTSLLDGGFFSPTLGSVGSLGQSMFLPYVW
jgi:hypothetical protein